MDADQFPSFPDIQAPPQFPLREMLTWLLAFGLYFSLAYWIGDFLPFAGAVLLGIALLARFVGKAAAILVAIAVLLLFLLLPAVDVGMGTTARRSTRRSICQNNLRQIALALQIYHDTYGTFPPAYIADETGKPIHSWRVLLLPFLEEKPLYDKYRFDEPWDGPHNRQLHDVARKIFRCPSDPSAKTDTNYVVVVGPGTMFPNDGCVSTADIKDGASNTLMVVEVRDSGIHWMEPRDLHVTQMATTINPPRGQGISSHHGSEKEPIAQAASAAGSVFFLKDPPPERLRAMLTIAGGEQIEDDD